MSGAAVIQQPLTSDASESDESLMERYRDGDAGAFDVLYLRHRAKLYRFLVHQTGSAPSAEEIYQDVWMSVIRSRETYQVTARFSTFLLTIAHHRVSDFFRDRVARLSVASEDEQIQLNDQVDQSQDPAHAAQSSEQIRRIDQALLQLSAEQREIFLLRQESDASLEELAEMTGVNRETAKSRLRYAVAHLKRILGGST
jgi:RNA polymerase sigma-70 factor (ECF subfamily)